MVENTTFDGEAFVSLSFRADSKAVIPPMSLSCLRGSMMLWKIGLWLSKFQRNSKCSVCFNAHVKLPKRISNLCLIYFE